MHTADYINPWKTAWLQLQQQLILYTPRLTAALIILMVSILLAYYYRQLMRKVSIKSDQKMHLMRFISSVVTAAIVIIGIMTGLATAGVNVAALITSLGLLGFSLGMAFKDLLANTVAGCMIMIYHPFQLNDYITVGTSSGRVIDVNLRYTTLKPEDGGNILIPNQTLLNTAICVS